MKCLLSNHMALSGGARVPSFLWHFHHRLLTLNSMTFMLGVSQEI